MLIATGSFAIRAQVLVGDYVAWPENAEIVDTGEGPVGVVGMPDGKNFQYGFYSKSGKAVMGCVAVVRTRDEVFLKQVFHGGASFMGGRNPFNIWRRKDVEASAWAVDWVLFVDGTTWGPDTEGRSADLLSYERGLDAAYAKAKALGIPLVPLALIRGWEFKLKSSELLDRSEKGWFNAGFDETASSIEGIYTPKNDHPYRQALAELKRSRDGEFRSLPGMW
jgi:hypothetical protein